jgi:hypothetical protein
MIEIGNTGYWIIVILLMAAIWYHGRFISKIAHAEGVQIGTMTGLAIGITQTATILTTGKYSVLLTDGEITNHIKVTDALIKELVTQIVITISEGSNKSILLKK